LSCAAASALTFVESARTSSAWAVNMSNWLPQGELVGIIAERHYAREIVLKGKTSQGTLVRDIM
jgi:hypothetical protein